MPPPCHLTRPSHQTRHTHLPLPLLRRKERLQNPDPLLQRLQPTLQPLLHSRLIISQFGVKVLAVWARAHGGAEYRLDEERVVLLERLAVGFAETDGELFVGVGEVVAEGLGGEVEAAVVGRGVSRDKKRVRGARGLGRDACGEVLSMMAVEVHTELAIPGLLLPCASCLQSRT